MMLRIIESIRKDFLILFIIKTISLILQGFHFPIDYKKSKVKIKKIS